MYDLAIVGGGIAGYTAALTAKNLSLSYLWLAPSAFSEKTSAAESVRNFPSFSGNGVEFSRSLEAQRTKEGVEITKAHVDAVFKTKEAFLLAAGKCEFEARAVILCIGVDLSGSVKGEKEFFGRGVSYCAVCDGALYRGKKIAAVLSSKDFSEEVGFLAGFAEKVHVFCPEKFSFNAPNIEAHTGKVLAVEGGTRVEKLLTGDGEFEVDGVFFLRNATPPEALCGGLKCDGAHIVVDRSLSTNIRGLFAAGDVTGTPYQYVKAAGEGLTAAFSAREYLKNLQH